MNNHSQYPQNHADYYAKQQAQAQYYVLSKEEHDALLKNAELLEKIEINTKNTHYWAKLLGVFLVVIPVIVGSVIFALSGVMR